MLTRPVRPILRREVRPARSPSALERRRGQEAVALAAAMGAAWWFSAMAAPAGAGDVAPTFDAAPFARVCTWDPSRTNGVRASRLEEIAAEDLFLETDLEVDADGTWHVSRAEDGRACVGLHWLEARLLRTLTLELADDGPRAPGVEPAVQVWTGATRWQGTWEPWAGRLETAGRGWRFTPGTTNLLAQKVRWLLPAGASPLRVQRLSAHTAAALTVSDITLLCDAAERSGEVRVEPYNAWLLDSPHGTGPRLWDPRQPLALQVRHAGPPPGLDTSGDRGALRFRFAGGAFAVALDDVLERGPVYVASVGLFVFPTRSPVDPAAYRREVATRKTILDEVRALPEQTRERAMRATHCDPRLDRGRMMLSLACDNAKFVSEADGTLSCYEEFADDAQAGAPLYRLMPRFGASRLLTHTQGWGTLGLNRAAHADPARALPLQIHERTYARGLGHHAPGEIVLDVSAGYDRFEAEVGLQWQGGSAPGSVVFEVWVDGRRAFNSGAMRERDEPQRVSVPLAGAQTLTLRLGDAGDGLGYDAANWAEARVRRGGTAQYLADLIQESAPTDRHLAEGWLPAPVMATVANGLVYRQRMYVAPFAPTHLPTAGAWSNAPSLGVVELTVENPTAEAATAQATFAFALGAARTNSPVIRSEGARALVCAGDRLLSVGEFGEGPAATWQASGSRLGWSAPIPAGGRAGCVLYLPAWSLGVNEAATLRGGAAWFDRFRDYWHSRMASAMQIELPDGWLADVIRANQAHVLIAARQEEGGRRIAPWIASDRYHFALDSEGHSVIRGMQSWGHFDFAQRALEYFFARQRPAGFMTTGYTLMGNGWHLWTLGEYVRLADAEPWLRSVADRPARLGRWVMAQLEKTRRTRADGTPVPEFGLMPPGVQADWDAYACYFYANAYFRAGLEAAGDALARVGHADAARMQGAAERLGEDLRRAFKATQALAPVVPLRNGTWVPYYPSSVHTPGPMAGYYPGQDGNRSWAYDVELGSHHLVALGALPPEAPEAGWMLDHMEDVQFLADGWGGYPAAGNRAAWFDLGGFAKVQPYYARHAEVLALRDDVKPFLRTYFNTLASLIDGTALSIFEHFSNFCYNKTHETGYFLHQSRTLLLTERGPALWLAPFAPRDWFRDAATLAVRNAPTWFGPTSYRVVSSVASGRIEAWVSAPTRQPPTHVVLRLRHPEQRPLRAVTVDGAPHPAFDVGKETITLRPRPGLQHVRAEY